VGNSGKRASYLCEKKLSINQIHESWQPLLSGEFKKEYFQELTHFVEHEYKNAVCFPPYRLIYNAFDRCHFQNVKVVIIGQDPYHGAGQANGLCFSVADGVRFPPSLRNIFKEVHADTGAEIPFSGNLERWADQGVLLINAILTVRAGEPGSHQGKGWEVFTDAIIQILNEQSQHLVFILWGDYARKKASIINSSKHCVLQSAHPSPFSARKGFFGNNHFSAANKYLISAGKEPIQW
jgi:uracil-DNA glycosylase